MAALAGAAVRSRMQYRANFVALVLMGLVYQLTGFAFIWVVLSRFQVIAGWTLPEVALIYGLRLLAHALRGVLFGGVSRVRGLIRDGNFDRLLVRPLPPLLHVIARELDTASVGDLIGGLVLFAAAARLAPVDWSATAVAYLALALVGGILIEAAVLLLVTTLSFRMIETGAVWFFVDDIFNQFGNYPLRIFGGFVQAALTWGLPVAFVAYVPAAVLLDRTEELRLAPAIAYGAPAVGFIWFVAAYLLWRSEMRQYQSAGH
jgi:ABC-2 type transport system permease protein